MINQSDFIARMEALLKEWDDGVDALSDESERASADARAAFHSSIKELRAHRDSAQRNFDEIRGAGDTVGTRLQDGMQATWEAMQRALERVSSEFRGGRQEACASEQTGVQASS